MPLMMIVVIDPGSISQHSNPIVPKVRPSRYPCSALIALL